MFPADMSLEMPGSIVRGSPTAGVTRDYNSEEEGEGKVKICDSHLLQGREATLHDCRMCTLTQLLFKRMFCDVGKSRNTTFSESCSGSEQQRRVETLSSVEALGLGHSKSSRGKTELDKVPSGSTCGKSAAGTHFGSLWFIFTQKR